MPHYCTPQCPPILARPVSATEGGPVKKCSVAVCGGPVLSLMKKRRILINDKACLFLSNILQGVINFRILSLECRHFSTDTIFQIPKDWAPRLQNTITTNCKKGIGGNIVRGLSCIFQHQKFSISAWIFSLFLCITLCTNFQKYSIGCLVRFAFK